MTDTVLAPRRGARWAITLAATAASTYALDAVAAGAGILLVGSHVLRGADHSAVIAFLGASYLAWAIGLRSNLAANWRLLERTGTSTNALSKAAYDLAGERTRRAASAAGYVATEVAKE